jgi:type I restriction enzyme S subunit
MSTEAPAGWEEKTLGNCAFYINGHAFKPEDWHETGTPIIRIEQLHDANAHHDFCQRELPDRFVINNGDLIFSWSATLSLKIWDRGRAFLNQHLYKVIPKNGVDRFFLKYLLESNLDKLTGETHGSTMKHITRPHLLEYLVTIPKSLSEQEKIAAVLQRVDNAIDKTKELIEKHKKMKQGLTQSLFDAKRLVGTEQKLSECCVFIRDGTHGSYEDSENGIPLLSAKDVAYGKVIRDNNPRRISLRDYYSMILFTYWT